MNGSSILVLGVAYKKDVNDVRESPALDIMRLLAADGADVEYHDPHVPRIADDGGAWESVELTDERLSSADAVVIATDHSAVDYGRVLDLAPVVVDARHVTAPLLKARDQRQRAWVVKGGGG